MTITTDSNYLHSLTKISEFFISLFRFLNIQLVYTPFISMYDFVLYIRQNYEIFVPEWVFAMNIVFFQFRVFITGLS